MRRAVDEKKNLDIKCPTRGDCIHDRHCLIAAHCLDPVVPPIDRDSTDAVE